MELAAHKASDGLIAVPIGRAIGKLADSVCRLSGLLTVKSQEPESTALHPADAAIVSLVIIAGVPKTTLPTIAAWKIRERNLNLVVATGQFTRVGVASR